MKIQWSDFADEEKPETPRGRFPDARDHRGGAIVSCNDGLRPVIMKLETTDEESKIDYHPIER